MKTKIITTLVVAVLIVGGIFLTKNKKVVENNDYLANSTELTQDEKTIDDTIKLDNPTVDTVIDLPNTKVAGYIIEDVAKHNNKNDCWAAVNGSVYNLTPWIANHPGGEGAILGLCGTDGSILFNGQHGGQQRPANELDGFKIGILN